MYKKKKKIHSGGRSKTKRFLSSVYDRREFHQNTGQGGALLADDVQQRHEYYFVTTGGFSNMEICDKRRVWK